MAKSSLRSLRRVREISPEDLSVLVSLGTTVEKYRKLLPENGIHGNSVYHQLYCEFVWLCKNTEVFTPTMLLLVRIQLELSGFGVLLEE